MNDATATGLTNFFAGTGLRHADESNRFGLRGMDHFALETQNIDLMERFVRELFGGEPYYYAGYDETDRQLGRVKHIFIRVGNVLLQCAEPKDNSFFSIRKDDPNVSPHWAFGVSAADLDRNLEWLRFQGIPVIGPIRHRGVDLTSIYFQSPEGHKFEIGTWEPYPQEKTNEGRIDWPSLAHDWPNVAGLADGGKV